MHPDNKQDAGWSFKNEDSTPAAQATQPVTWTASEFIAHHKDGAWYATATGGVALLCAFVFLFTRDVISIITISVVFLLFLVVSSGKPRQRSYSVDSHGVSIDEKFHPYNAFKSFDVVYEGAIGSINFIPLKRFMPELTIYFAPDDEAKIVEILAQHLPYDERKEQGVDRLMRRMRF